MPLTRVHRFDDVSAFVARVSPFLLAHEAEYNLLLGILERLRGLRESPRGPLLALVEDSAGECVMVAIQTPSANLVITRAPADALDAMARFVATEWVPLPGVLGPSDEVARFAVAYSTQTNRTARIGMRQRIYESRRVIPPRPVEGALRLAEVADIPLVAAWCEAFMSDAGVPPSDALRLATRHVTERSLYLWQTTRPVSMANWCGPTPSGARINLVYTPPDLRGRGYASACVAGVTDALFAMGRTLAFLYTDLANPTSNRIYQRIGYEPVCDSDEYRFDEDPRGT